MSASLPIRQPLRVLGHVLSYAALWLVLAGADPLGWIIGLPTVLFASWASLRLSAKPQRPGEARPSIWGLLRFLPFFALESVRGGVDVAARVMRPRLRIEPGFQQYRLSLRNPLARVVLLDSISLLPGTLSADLRDDIIEVHALGASSDLEPALQRLERRISRIFPEPSQEPYQ
ncbi:MAG: Na+/H+ antiporter subunit E [Halochromatium sp.]|uniref:Na+/H+ antiporter subunit E n=1 Tax=Halochromatium sp. TaxID=2049430 RepID=UPI0039791AD6